MPSVVTRDGNDALKVFAHGSFANIALLVQLADCLHTAGVPVPKTRRDESSTGIRLPWIEGQTMSERIKCVGNLLLARDDIGCAMGVLRQLHESSAPNLNLTEFNPFRVTDRRMSEPVFQTLPISICNQARLLRAKLENNPPRHKGENIIHGDFHAGQLILEAAVGKWWVIDLDDVSHGHGEADIANFCVNLATSKNQTSAGIIQDFEAIATQCRHAYAKVMRRELLDHYAACALLRRAVKFAARGDHKDRIAAVLDTCSLLT